MLTGGVLEDPVHPDWRSETDISGAVPEQTGRNVGQKRGRLC